MSSLILNLTSDASVRGMVAPDGSHRFSVYDFITMACQKADGGAYARKTYSNLVKEGSELKDEIVPLVQRYHFPGGRGAATPTMTVEGLLNLVNVMGNKVSQAFGMEVMDILARYLEGDPSLCTEIQANKTLGNTASYARFTEKILKRVEQIKEKEASAMPMVSYVYATKSPAFPGMIKLGKTVNMDARLVSLNTSCAPAPHVVVAMAPSLDNTRDERTAHQFFATKRKHGEFFEISEAEVQSYFINHITNQFNLDMSQIQFRAVYPHRRPDSGTAQAPICKLA